MGDDASLDALVEAEKKRFKGRELFGKALGVVGLGAIGSLVARAALDLGMEVLGYDPAISVEAAWRLPSEVKRMENLPSLFARSDYVTLHVPLLPETEGLIGRESFRSFRRGAVLLNFAREPIVDRQALGEALGDGTLAHYIADFPVPGLTDHPRVRFTPHLGASTEEAEENCAVMAANQLTSFLETGNITNSVNFPSVALELSEGYRLAVANLNVPGMLGQMTSVLARRRINVVDMINKSRGGVAYNLLDLQDAPTPGLIEELAAIDTVINVRVLNGLDNGAPDMDAASAPPGRFRSLPPHPGVCRAAAPGRGGAREALPVLARNLDSPGIAAGCWSTRGRWCILRRKRGQGVRQDPGGSARRSAVGDVGRRDWGGRWPDGGRHLVQPRCGALDRNL